MTIFELRRISPLRCANVVAAVSVVVYAGMALLALPLVLLAASAISHLPPGGRAPPFPTTFFQTMMVGGLVAYPILGGVMGWLMGGLGALAYNWITQYTGGFEVEGIAVPWPSDPDARSRSSSEGGR